MSKKLKSLLKRLRRLGFRFKPEKITDPVCDMEVRDDFVSIVHQNKKYSFCSEHCRQEFDNSPSKYAV